MTVKELLLELQRYPLDAVVYVSDSENGERPVDKLENELWDTKIHKGVGPVVVIHWK